MNLFPFQRLLLVTLLCAGALPVTALAQDSRQVTEPQMPAQACAVLLAAHAGPKSAGANDTARLQKALDACPAGQAVHLAPANELVAFVSGPLSLPSGVTLVVDKGATLYASTNPQWFDDGTGQCGQITAKNIKACKALITVADNARGSGVMGDGTIDGQGGERMDGSEETWWQLARRAQAENGHQNVPRILVSKGARELTLYRITLRNSPNFHVWVQQADGFTAWGVTIDAPPRARNTDGIDPASSRNVTIAHSLLRTGDDSVAIKGGSLGPAENVSILHNRFYNGHGMSIGSETDGGVRRVLVQDLAMEGSVAGLRIKSDVSRGGLVSDVTYRDVCLRHVATPIEFDTQYTRNAKGSLIPQYTGIVLDKVHSLTPGRVQLRGIDEAHALAIRLDDVAVAGPAPVNQRPPEFASLQGNIGQKVSPARQAECAQRLQPFPEPQAVNRRPQLSDAQANAYSMAEVLKYAGSIAKEVLAPWDPMADPLVANPAALKADYTVDAGTAPDGRTRFASIQAAVNHALAQAASAPAGPKRRVVIAVHPGTYNGLVYLPASDKLAITLLGTGSDATQVRLVASLDASTTGADFWQRHGTQFDGAPPEVLAMAHLVKAKTMLSTQSTATVWVAMDGFQARNLTVENAYYQQPQPPGPHQAVALMVDGADKAQFDQVRLLAWQDTLYLRARAIGETSRSFFHRAFIQGDVDFIFGDAVAYFFRSEIKSLGTRVGHAESIAPSTHALARYGFVFNDSDFTHDGSPAALAGDRMHLGRQWFRGARCTPYTAIVSPAGYSCRFNAEFDDFQPPQGRITRGPLEAVGKVAILNSRLGRHLNAAQPWSDWNRHGTPSYRPVQYDRDGYIANLRAAGIVPTQQLGYTQRANEPFLAEYRNTTAP